MALRELRIAAQDMPTISLDSLTEGTALQTRIDRKYVVPSAMLGPLVGALPASTAVLAVEGRISSRYETVYFDTADLASYHAAAFGRRRRFKVRTRAYLDTGRCMLEVKRRGGRDETVKDAIEHGIDERYVLGAGGAAFVADRILLPRAGGELRPSLTTEYQRTTFVDELAATRATVDVGLVCRTPGGSTVALEDHVLVETKSAGPVTLVDRALWRAGVRPVSMSKYCVGMAALNPGLPANKWNVPLRRYFGWRPARSAR